MVDFIGDLGDGVFVGGVAEVGVVVSVLIGRDSHVCEVADEGVHFGGFGSCSDVEVECVVVGFSEFGFFGCVVGGVVRLGVIGMRVFVFAASASVFLFLVFVLHGGGWALLEGVAVFVQEELFELLLFFVIVFVYLLTFEEQSGEEGGFVGTELELLTGGVADV